MSTVNPTMHLWARALPLADRPKRGYAACGVHIGRFTQDLKTVNCTLCLEVVNAKKGRDEPVAPDGQ